MGIGINESFESIDLYFKRIISRNSDLTDTQIENINKFLENLKSKDIVTNISSEKELDERNKIIIGYVENFYSEINTNEDAYKEALGEDFNNIKIVIDNMKNMREIEKTYFQDDLDMKNILSIYMII